MLYRQVEEDWRTFENTPDIRIVRDYAIKTCKFCPVYAGVNILVTNVWLFFKLFFYSFWNFQLQASVYGGLLPVAFLPIIPAFLEACGLIKQEEKLLPFPVQYFVDVDKYYYHVILDGFYSTFYLVMIVVSVDSFFVLFLNHACCLCAIVG